MKRHDTSTPWARAESSPAEVTTETPARAADLIADLAVPLCQSLVTGALLGGLAVFVLGELAPDWEVNRFKIWAGLALGICAVTWGILLWDTRALLRTAETLTGLDLNRDGVIGKPRERIVIANVGQAQQEAEARANVQRRSEFAQFVAALPVKGTALRTWEPELGREAYQEYRDALLRLGWAAWNSTKRDGTPNTRRGWELTRPAAEILERIQSE
jgi:hypothetical protein